MVACSRNRVLGPSATLAALLALPASVAPEAICGHEPRVTLSAAEPVQGSVVLVEASGSAAEDVLTASWAGREVRFWREGPEGPLRALVGIDLEHPPGPAPLVLRSAGAPCRVALEVRAGSFPVERLKVPRGYVELSPRNLARAREETRRLDDLYRRVSPDRLWRGAFAPPLPGAPASDNFGRRRVLNGEPRSPHSGVDFSADPGTPVLAPQRGRVVLAASLFFSGRTVILDHGLGLFSSYAHLREMDVKEGELVEPGAVLGRVGATGRVTGPHLHWAMRLNLARVNPMDILTLF